MKEEVMNYVAPCIEVIEVEVESGFVASGENPGSGGETDLSNYYYGTGNFYAIESPIESMQSNILAAGK